MTTRVPHPKLAWWLVGIALGLVLLWAAYLNIGVLLLSIFIYYATRPLLRRVEQVIPSQSIATVISLLLFVLPALIVVGYTVNIAINELYNVIVSFGAVNIEPYIEPYVSQDLLGIDWSLLLTDPKEFFATTSSVVLFRRIFSYVLTSVGVVGTVTINLLLVFILTFYLLRDDTRISRWINTHFGTYLPQWEVYVKEVDEDLQTIFFGNILHSVITAVIAVALYTLLSIFNPTAIPIPYPALSGLLAGIASLIPIVGTKLVYLPVGGYMALWSVSFGVGGNADLSFPLVFIGLSYIIVDQIPDLGIRPYVSTKRVHMGLVMIAYIVGPLLFGWYGLFLGPVLLILSLHFATHILPYLLEPKTSEFEDGSSDSSINLARVFLQESTETNPPPSDGGSEDVQTLTD